MAPYCSAPYQRRVSGAGAQALKDLCVARVEVMNDNTALIIQSRESGRGPKCGNPLCQNPFQPKKKHAPIQ